MGMEGARLLMQFLSSGWMTLCGTETIFELLFDLLWLTAMVEALESPHRLPKHRKY
jgi:hypothetical protein